MTRKYTGDVDPQQTGRSLSVADVVTGHFRNTGGRIGITVEAIDVEKNDVLWRDSLELPTEDLIAMRNGLSDRVRAGLLPLLHVAEQSEPSRPRNDEAYALFLRAAAMSNDPQPNKQALAALERAVQLDPSYAPAWAALSQRSYYSGSYGDGGEAAFQRAEIKRPVEIRLGETGAADVHCQPRPLLPQPQSRPAGAGLIRPGP